MQFWKFLLLGITGDLAKKKILPALAQFSIQNEEKVQVDLIGYSRSQANLEEIEQILNKNPIGTHKLGNIELVQGSYDDPKLLSGFLKKLNPGERLVVYLAIPPSQFLRILENNQNVNDLPLEIIMEKPFGESIEDAKQILDLIQKRGIEKHVHFTDHYLFKTATQLEKPDLQNLKNLRQKTIQSIQVRALEDVDLKGRSGYYEGVGATKDMLPSHLYSLTKLCLESIGTDLNDLQTFKISNLVLGQYKSYIKSAQLAESFTETYFEISGQFKSREKKIDLLFESGKKLGIKLTQINVHFTDNSELIWNIQPEMKLELDSPEASFSLNLNKNDKLDHNIMLEDIMLEQYDNFLSPNDVIIGWNLYEKVLDFAIKRRVRPMIYKDDKWPVKMEVKKTVVNL